MRFSHPAPQRVWAMFAILALSLLWAGAALAHAVTLGDKGYIQEITGPHIIPFVYLGAKHMVTGYDHLLFLFGVIFFLRRMKDVALYVTLFAAGHSATLLFGVVREISANSYLVDAVIGLSVVYKALDNLGSLQKWLGFQPSTKAATLVFGLCHGFGLATKLLDFQLDSAGLLTNLVSFNVGVELGQLLALYLILLGMNVWRNRESFASQAQRANWLLLAAGLMLTALQLHGYWTEAG